MVDSRFGQFDYGQGLFGAGGTSPEPPLVTPDGATVRVAWEFFDGTNTYTLPVNPKDAKMPVGISRKMSMQATCAGSQISFQGRNEVPRINFSGVILEEAQVRAFEQWFSLRKQIRITDDLGQKFWIYIKSFSPTREKHVNYPWYTNYTAEGILLDRG